MTETTEVITEKQVRLTNEVILYTLIFIVGGALRLILLGRTPLTEDEATWAYQAWQVCKGEVIPLGTQVSYLAFTEGLFSLFGSSEFAARLWPALAGSLLIWAPYTIRKEIGRTTALVLGLGIAFDPVLVSVSRIAGSPMPALVFLILTGLYFHQRKFSWSLAFLLLGALSGPAFWQGAVLVCVSLMLAQFMRFADVSGYIKLKLQTINTISKEGGFNVESWLLPILFAIGFGSFFFSQPVGLSAWGASIPEYIRGWYTPMGVNPLKLLAALPISNPFVLVFGGLGFLSSWLINDRMGKTLTLWFLCSLLLIVVYPSRGTSDLIWVVVPLWLSGGRELIRLFQLAETKWHNSVLSGSIVVLLILNWLIFTGMVYQAGNIVSIIKQWAIIAASLALIIVGVSFIGSEIGWPAAMKGLAIGFAIGLSLYNFSALAQGAYLRPGDPRSLWVDEYGSGQMHLLVETISDVSITQTGRWDTIEGATFDASPATLWTLRKMINFQHYTIYDPAIIAPVMLTREQGSQVISQELYRGQDFILTTRPGWQGLFPDDWISWIAFRDGPLAREYMILWVRNDLLTGN